MQRLCGGQHRASRTSCVSGPAPLSEVCIEARAERHADCPSRPLRAPGCPKFQSPETSKLNLLKRVGLWFLCLPSARRRGLTSARVHRFKCPRAANLAPVAVRWHRRFPVLQQALAGPGTRCDRAMWRRTGELHDRRERIDPVTPKPCVTLASSACHTFASWSPWGSASASLSAPNEGNIGNPNLLGERARADQAEDRSADCRSTARTRGRSSRRTRGRRAAAKTCGPNCRPNLVSVRYQPPLGMVAMKVAT